MANTILTPDMITKEALRVLHEKTQFIGSINKQYDSSFAQSGAKIGDTLRIRKPAQFKTRSGMTMDSPTQDYVEQTVPLTVEDVLGVDIQFSELDLTLELDDFSKRFIEPAVSQIAAELEEDVLGVAFGQSVVSSATQDSELYRDFLQAAAYLDNLTTPRDASRCVLVDTNMEVALVDSLKGLFQDSTQISKQYREGKMGRTAGADWYASSYIPLTQAAPEASYAIVSFSEGNPNIGSNAGASMTITSVGAGDIAKGTVFELSGCNAIQPQTKKSFAGQKVYVTAQADVTISGAGNHVVPIAAPIISDNTDARQNVSAAPVNAVTLAAGNYQSLFFHKDFMTFATADLTLPKGVDMASRQVFEGISMSFVRDFNISDRTYPARLDVLYGKKVIRPEYGATVVKGY
jgi:hypothetical protein